MVRFGGISVQKDIACLKNLLRKTSIFFSERPSQTFAMLKT